MDKAFLKNEFNQKLFKAFRIPTDKSSLMQQCYILSQIVRFHIKQHLCPLQERKRVYYLSMEFFPGKLLKSWLLNLGIREMCIEVLDELGLDLTQIENTEPEPGLGSGGLGRLAACFLDSLATLDFSGYGFGIRFSQGYFQQKIIEGSQIEIPDSWLSQGDLWTEAKPSESIEVKFNPNLKVEAIPYDLPIVGYDTKRVNTLRLWATPDPCNPISCSLYPDDSTLRGQALRLKQEYFLVSASIQTILNGFRSRSGTFKELDKFLSIHVNDTHPALAIPELMRILVDEENICWDTAWHITQQTISYTNHTILSEALEKWPTQILRSLLPRIYEIIVEINERFCKGLWDQYTGEWERIGNMAVIAYDNIRMANLATVGSHSINGVSQIHTKILREQVMEDFGQAFPDKFLNITNGVSHRRWLLQANPLLAKLITSALGDDWIRDPIRLKGLLQLKKDASFKQRLFEIKQINKEALAKHIKEKYHISVDPTSLFDVQVKRIHGYKRQLLNLLHIMYLYEELRNNPNQDRIPRTYIFSGKAAHGYVEAKQTILLIHRLADIINSDLTINGQIKIVFLENYSVSLAEKVFPAADITEYISSAGKEASATGNMKSIMNGAPLICTLDGANIEIMDAVGPENIFTFGMTENQVRSLSNLDTHSSWGLYNQNSKLKKIIDWLASGFGIANNKEFSSLYDALVYNRDGFFVLKDFSSYAQAQERVDNAWRNQSQWLEKCLTNIAHSGKFSSDISIRTYAKDVWHLI